MAGCVWVWEGARGVVLLTTHPQCSGDDVYLGLHGNEGKLLGGEGALVMYLQYRLGQRQGQRMLGLQGGSATPVAPHIGHVPYGQTAILGDPHQRGTGHVCLTRRTTLLPADTQHHL